jgi:hypothetical protein
MTTLDISNIDAVQRELETCATILGGHCLGIQTAISVALGGEYFGDPIPEFAIVPSTK